MWLFSLNSDKDEKKLTDNIIWISLSMFGSDFTKIFKHLNDKKNLNIRKIKNIF